MKQQTIYKIIVDPQAAASVYEGFFLQYPTRDELESVIKNEIERLESHLGEDEGDRIGDRISDLNNAYEVVAQAEDLVRSFYDRTELQVAVASVVIGEITIVAIEAYGRDPKSVLEQLVA